MVGGLWLTVDGLRLTVNGSRFVVYGFVVHCSLLMVTYT